MWLISSRKLLSRCPLRRLLSIRRGIMRGLFIIRGEREDTAIRIWMGLKLEGIIVGNMISSYLLGGNIKILKLSFS